ncbi:hypothetical protein OAV47_00815 [bacterium]|nr:hypothetical protein [bacterium]
MGPGEVVVPALLTEEGAQGGTRVYRLERGKLVEAEPAQEVTP